MLGCAKHLSPLLLHAAEATLLTRVRGRCVLGTSPVRGSRQFADAETCTLRILSVPNVGRDTGLEGVFL